MHALEHIYVFICNTVYNVFTNRNERYNYFGKSVLAPNFAFH